MSKLRSKAIISFNRTDVLILYLHLILQIFDGNHFRRISKTLRSQRMFFTSAKVRNTSDSLILCVPATICYTVLDFMLMFLWQESLFLITVHLCTVTLLFRIVITFLSFCVCLYGFTSGKTSDTYIFKMSSGCGYFILQFIIGNSLCWEWYSKIGMRGFSDSNATLK